MGEAKALTVRSIDAIKGGATRAEIRDAATRNLYLIVQPSGAKSWAWRGRVKGSDKLVKRTLGPYPALSLADARTQADTITRDAAAGIDRVEVVAQAKVAEAIAAEDAGKRSHQTLLWYWDTYYHPEKVAAARSRIHMESMFRSVASLHNLALLDITADHIDDALDIVAKRGKVMAARVSTMVRAILRRTVTHHRRVTGMTASPGEYMASRAVKSDRKRTLTRAEQVGLCVVIMDPPPRAAVYAQMLRLALETGVRITEARKATWDEFDFEKREWTLPAERTKNKKIFIATLADETVAWLQARKAGTNSRYVFASPLGGNAPMNAVSRCQDMIRDALVRVMGHPVPEWGAHDLRRTLSTGLNEIAARSEDARLSVIVVEATINHISGQQSGVAGRYNQYDYLGPKRHALRVWQDHLNEVRAEATRLVERPTTGQ